MAPSLLYTVCVIGAIALFLLLRPAARPVKLGGAILGLGAFGWLLAMTVERFAAGTGARPETFYVIFSVIALAASVRLITHSRPVYSALYFVMVVLSTAAMFLLLAAEFMAFALVIVYAGAILVTYMFVLMLAQQSPDPEDESGQPEYDRNPREPAAAAVVGFLMLALLSKTIFQGGDALPPPPEPQAAHLEVMRQLNAMPKALDEVVEQLAPGATAQPNEEGESLIIRGETAYVRVTLPGETLVQEIEVPVEYAPGNVQLVGLALVARFPVSLELAGVILLMAMFGAVVLARRQIELSEDEVRVAAGLRPMSPDEDDDGRAEPIGRSGGDA